MVVLEWSLHDTVVMLYQGRAGTGHCTDAFNGTRGKQHQNEKQLLVDGRGLFLGKHIRHVQEKKREMKGSVRVFVRIDLCERERVRKC